GGVVSPILMNLFMHYTFDAWMKRRNPLCPFARYADDAVVHCRTQKQAEEVMQSIALRLAECGLTMHPEKSKIVYCKDSNRTESSPHVYFTFLGFTFQPRKALSKQRRIFTSFLPGVSKDALKRMRQTVRGWKLNRPATANRFYAEDGESLKVSSETVGHVLKYLGLYSRRLGNAGRGLIFDKAT